MSSSTFTQILFRSLLDSPAIVEITAQVLEKAMPIIREHFTFSADEISPIKTVVAIVLWQSV